MLCHGLRELAQHKVSTELIMMRFLQNTEGDRGHKPVAAGRGAVLIPANDTHQNSTKSDDIACTAAAARRVINCLNAATEGVGSEESGIALVKDEAWKTREGASRSVLE